MFGHSAWDSHTSYASEGECNERGFGGTAIIDVFYDAGPGGQFACQPKYMVAKCNGTAAGGDSISWAINSAVKWGDEYIIESCWLEDEEIAIASGKSVTDLKVYELKTISEGLCQKVLVEEGDKGRPIYGCMDDTAENYDPDATEDDSSCKYGENDEEGSNLNTIFLVAAVAVIGSMFI